MNKLVKRALCVISALLLILAQFSFVNNKSAETKTPVINSASDHGSFSFLYNDLHLGNAGLSKEAFDYALRGYNYLLTTGKILNDETLSIVDFSLPSTAKRLFVL